MAAPIYRASVAGGGTTGTGDRTVTFTPNAGDLLLVFAHFAANTQSQPGISDNQGGTYTFVGRRTWNSGNNNMLCWVRDSLIASAVSHTITIDTDTNDAGNIVAVAFTNVGKAGAAAIRSFGGEDDGVISTTPAPTLNQSALTRNPTAVAVASADTTTTPPTNWTERQEAAQATPTTNLEVATRNSGFTGTTITYGAACGTAFASMAVEIDGDIPIAGAIAGTCTVAGALIADASIVGVAAGACTAVGALSAEASIVGTASGTSTTTGILAGIGALAGSSDGVADSSGTLTGLGALAGAIAALAAAVALLTGIGALTGSSDGLADAVGILENATPFVPIDGQAAGTCAVTGFLSATVDIQGAAAGTCTVNGELIPNPTGEAEAEIVDHPTSAIVQGPATRGLISGRTTRAVIA